MERFLALNLNTNTTTPDQITPLTIIPLTPLLMTLPLPPLPTALQSILLMFLLPPSTKFASPRSIPITTTCTAPQSAYAFR
jgi:hypothetical protein